MKIIIIIFLISCITSFSKLRQSYEYSNRFSYALGLKTNLIADRGHPARIPLRESGGGGLRLMQSGLEAKSTIYLDKDSRYRIPIVIDYVRWKSTETITFSDVALQFKNQVNVVTFSSGFHYAFAYFYNSNAWIYSGLEFTGNYFHNSQYRYREIDNLDNSSVFEINREPKNNIWRFGTNLRLGMEAELEKRLMINFSLNLHIVNLIGRDDNVGQLLVVSTLDKKEDFLPLFNISLMLQYRI
ncbi:hypothetical protein OAQ99_01360 [Candidatus Kapabacteria bacterium]|nr:hypothetical protein [Candidatus Kapabacteria bacterium]